MPAVSRRALLLAALLSAQAASPLDGRAQSTAAAPPTKAHVAALASEALEGRLAGSPGERLAAEYLVSQLKRIGARPLPGRTDYRLPFEFTAGGTTDNGRLEILGYGDGSFRVGTASLMPADNVKGWRRDTLARLRELDSPVYRWPGGNFVSGYDWKDGVGERDKRPPRKNPAWKGVEHRVTVTLDGRYDFEGRLYPSLSMIAREITGTRWSGPLFFGVRHVKAPAKPKNGGRR